MCVTVKLTNLPKLCVQKERLMSSFFCNLLLGETGWNGQIDGGMFGYLCVCMFIVMITHQSCDKLITRNPKQTRFKTSGGGHDFTLEQEDVTDA